MRASSAAPSASLLCVRLELHDTEYGDRRYDAYDPEGHFWSFATHVRDMAPSEWGASGGVSGGAGNGAVVNRFKRMTHAAVYGLRGDLARKVERPLARRTPLSRESVGSLFGALYPLLVVEARRPGASRRAAMSGA